jgi:hypothetical protein
MDADTARDLAALRSTHESLHAQVARLQWLVQWGLLTMVLFVPLARWVDDDESDTTSYSLYAAIGFFLSARPADLGGSEAHPYAVPGGRIVTILGLFLILVGVLATAVTSVLLRHPDSTRRAAFALQLSATVLLLGALAAFIGLAGLPDDDDLAIRPAWGLLVAVGASGWAYHSAWSAKDR